MKLQFNPTNKIIIIDEEGEIKYASLYIKIRQWEASVDGIVYDTIAEGVTHKKSLDGKIESSCMTLHNGWRLSSDNKVSIVDGFVEGRDKDGNYYNPVVEESRDNISLLIEDLEQGKFVPTESQKQYALSRAKLFGEDWEVVTQPSPIISRKADASESVKPPKTGPPFKL